MVVTNSGDRQGQWYDFKQNVGGNPIDAIAYARKVAYIDALKIAADEFDFSEGLTRNSYVYRQMFFRRPFFMLFKASIIFFPLLLS